MAPIGKKTHNLMPKAFDILKKTGLAETEKFGLGRG
jgi:hypothetical protein